MKIYLLIATCLLFSCYNNNKKTQPNIIVDTVFETILKEIHLAEASFEINKTKNLKHAKGELTNAYFNIYQKHQISKKVFTDNLDYHSRNPEKLEKIYDNILEQLTREKASIDRK